MAASNAVVNLDEYQLLAMQKMPKMFYDFYAGGAEDQWTLQENRQAFLRIRIRAQVLVDVSNVDMSTSILGFRVPFPIMIAPTALHKMAHPEGELATARAAAATKAIMVLSTSASSTMEEVAGACPGIRLFQLYVFSRAKTLELLQRAERAGYKAVVLTVDTPMLGRREADLRNRLVLPPNITMKHLEDVGDQHTKPAAFDSKIASFAASHMDKTLTWKDIDWLKSVTVLPILLKGILTRESAERAVQSGVSGIIVSNHGGRQLDHVPATISVLEEVVTAVAGRIPVYMDGGIRRGTDVFKALALGASAVLIGRPVLFGLAVDGEQGVIKVVEMLRDELKTTMSLAGCQKLGDINRQCVECPAKL